MNRDVPVEPIAKADVPNVNSRRTGSPEKQIPIGPVMETNTPKDFIGAVVINLDGLIAAGRIARRNFQRVKVGRTSRRQRRLDLIAEGDLPPDRVSS